MQHVFTVHSATSLLCPCPPPCFSYANARTSGIVVDMGASSTSIVPVQDGYPLMMGTAFRALIRPRALVYSSRQEPVGWVPRVRSVRGDRPLSTC